MKIVFVFFNPEIRTGGHKRYLELAEGLGRKGHSVFFLKNGALPETPGAVTAIDLVYPKRSLPYSLTGLFLVFAGRRRWIKTIGTCDYVVVFGETHLFAGLYLAKLLSGALLFSYRSNGVEECGISLEENAGNRKKRFFLRLARLKYGFFEKLVAAFSKLTVFQSDYDRNSFLSRNKRPKTETRVIRGNIGEPRFRAEMAGRNVSREARNLLYVGSLNERKGVSYLIDAAAVLKKEGIPFELRLIGFGELEGVLKKRVEEEALGECVRFLGRSKDPLPDIAGADLVVVPSLFDSYPNVVLEALHAGTPVIASRTAGIPDMLFHEELLFEPGDSESLARKIKELIERPDLYRRAKDLCAERKAQFLFDWPGEFEKAMSEGLRSGGAGSL